MPALPLDLLDRVREMERQLRALMGSANARRRGTTTVVAAMAGTAAVPGSDAEAASGTPGTPGIVWAPPDDRLRPLFPPVPPPAAEPPAAPL
ncbi:hypothetical protein [Allostreptomyces psammosilenae]|uniref:Uncharacterized protein n=1 Tax=Allostreptomyces psammosilenae TaxID=1892865 RepID=A0A852ZVI6_9ACTN|nr:hypothetical protein [Allostreptomyces psammosilenae]NYI05260.1 hypothetical protein [Allostreptomyces psammosilenae]